MFYALHYMSSILHMLLEFVGFDKVGHESFHRYQQYERQIFILTKANFRFVGLGRGC